MQFDMRFYCCQWVNKNIIILINVALLAMIALSVVQSDAQTFIRNAIFFINTLNNA